MKNRLRKIKYAVVVALIALITIAPSDVLAADVQVSASRDDIYNKLLEASRINVVANTLKKCIASIPGDGYTESVTAKNVKAGKVFSGGISTLTNTEISTALWVESKIQGNGGDDGAIWCKQDKGGNNILQYFAELTDMSVESMMCNNGTHRLMQRAYEEWDYSGGVMYWLGEDKNCNSFNDTGAVYLRAKDAAEQFKNIYTDWYNRKKVENLFLPSYNELGSFNNVDGYFNYIADFNLVCKADRVRASGKIEGTDYYGITEYNKSTNKIVAQNFYYHVNNNKTWSYSLTTDNPVTSCSGLLNRISVLQTTNNGIPIAGRSGGYENIILADLNDACRQAKTADGANSWEELRVRLQEIIDDPSSSDETVEKARTNLQKVNSVINSGNYIESSGSKDDDEGMIYQCVNIDGLDIDVDDYDTPITDIDTGSVDDGNSICYEGSGALGWLICPIVTMASGIGEHMWNQIEEYHLKVPASEIFKEGGGVNYAWSIVRDIANVLFVALFLFVIFSQLTGVGIDNYGIKKILPKLIVVAILINLSYVICELAVDVSNILGVGLNSLLSNAASEVGAAEGISGGSYAASWSVTGLLAVGGTGLFLLLNPAGALAAAAAIGLSVLGLVISVVTSMLFLYLILIVREAGIVLAIVIAPVALACYMLPNTEKLYKKWFDIFKALLVVYPLCGALVGAGQLAGAVLSNIEGMGVAAMLVQVLPFFLLPMLLKNSLSLLGNVGAKLSNVGRSWGKKGSSAVQNGIKNTNRFKNWQQYQSSQAAVRRATRTRDRLSGKTNLSARQKDRLRKAEDVMIANERLENENNRRVDGTSFEARQAAMEADVRAQESKDRTTLMMASSEGKGMQQLLADWNKAFDAGSDGELDALTNVITLRYGAAGANQIASSLSKKTGIAGNTNYQKSMQTLQRTMNNNSNFAGFMRSKASDAYQMISDAGMRYDQTANGGKGGMVHEDMNYFSAHNNTATAAKDWATSSAATLQRAVDSGALSNEMINDLLNSEDPAIKSGLRSEKGKTDVLQAALYNRQHNPSGMGPILSNEQAATRYRQERTDAQNESEIFISHERDAERIGKTTITVNPGSVITGAPATTFEGYATPAGFNAGGAAPTRNADGHWIYEDRSDPNNIKRWNATTGRYMPPTPPVPPTP